MYSAFGDESVGPDYASYATILVDSNRISEVDDVIGQVKIASGAKVIDVFHCRQLFSGQQRQKTAWSQKTMAEVFDIYGHLMQQLDGLLIRKIVATGKKSDFPRDAGGQWQASPDFVGPLPWQDGYEWGEKHVARLCAQGTMIPLSKWPGFENMQFWADPDTTPIVTEKGRRQFSKVLGLFVEGGGRSPNVMEPDGEKSALLQVADLVAYVAQRCAHGGSGPNDRRFKKLFEQIDAENIALKTGADGGYMIKVPNAVLNFQPE